MERIFCVPYSLYPGYGNMLRLGQSGPSEHRQPNWRQTNVPPTFLARPRLLMPSNASDYCVDPYKRAQLMAVFSHMNPGLSLRLRKANTKDVGVQVSPRVGKSVQCSLGPRTLDSLSSWASAGHRAPASAWGVSSPVPGHWCQVLLRKAPSGPPEAGQPLQPLPPPRSEEDPLEELQLREELAEEDSSSPRERKSKAALVDSSQPPGRPNFQVYFKQLCCKCQKSFNPYRVEAIQCQDLSSPTRDQTCPSLHWKCGVLTTEPQGTSPLETSDMSEVYIFEGRRKKRAGAEAKRNHGDEEKQLLRVVEKRDSQPLIKFLERLTLQRLSEVKHIFIVSKPQSQLPETGGLKQSHKVSEERNSDQGAHSSIQHKLLCLFS
ncbi:protein ZAR1-like isoform X4 [Odocoileus virginianus]|uniref:Protein ZAR1-like isoform X4 n=1 Tax=Odocoileus virginianus TaxID=9874 RepID=A0ABM4IJ74_ODOVR